ncbi:hypothetical protein [Silvimonas sp.]|uniref:hypothetical protein n=1 Tax=Silvimonas sp. TaxID=2650811 RepID=UPI0028462F7D|nr:hypothetical protein [Silvimonas sp.]MDR3426907.1 hypothetical protein [Silvimonas sp.]
MGLSIVLLLSVFAEYVHRGNDILTPDQLITALKDKPPINTMVAGVVVNAERLKRLEAVELKEKVVGLALARCVMYPPAPEDFNAYVEVRRYGVVSEAPSSRRLSREVLEAAIPAELRTKPAGFWCLSGCVLKHAMLEPTKLALSRSWEPKYKTEVVEETRDGAPDGDAGDDQLDVVVTDEVIIIPKVGTFYRCRTCCELVSAWGLRRHQCKGEPSSVISGMSALNQAKRLVLTDKPTDAPPTRLRLLDADMVVCPPLPRGFARRPKKDSSRFDPAVRAFIKRLFDEGNAPGAMKKWNEVEALDLLRTSTNPKFTAAQLEKPTAQNIKSLFARFSSELKEARKPILQAAVSNTREPVVPPLPAPAPSQAAMPQAPPAAPIVSVRADGVGNKRHVQPVAPEAPAAVLLASPPLPKRPRPAQPVRRSISVDLVPMLLTLAVLSFVCRRLHLMFYQMSSRNIQQRPRARAVLLCLQCGTLFRTGPCCPHRTQAMVPPCSKPSSVFIHMYIYHSIYWGFIRVLGRERGRRQSLA